MALFSDVELLLIRAAHFCDCETDLLTVSETATEPPQEEGSNLNSPKNLSLEATFVNHNFSQQVLKIVSHSPVSDAVVRFCQ